MYEYSKNDINLNKIFVYFFLPKKCHGDFSKTLGGEADLESSFGFHYRWYLKSGNAHVPVGGKQIYYP